MKSLQPGMCGKAAERVRPDRKKRNATLQHRCPAALINEGNALSELNRKVVQRLFREAVDAYLQGKWNESRRRIERILAMDDTDADALMHLGAIYVRTHQPEQARRAYRQCLEHDGGGKWRWEVERALAALDRRDS